MPERFVCTLVQKGAINTLPFLPFRCHFMCAALLEINLGRVANARPVATIKKLATGRVVQRQVLTGTVGHSETDFLRRLSDLDLSSGNGARVYETGLGFATRPR